MPYSKKYKGPLPQNETGRLKAIFQCHYLHQEDDQQFHALTKLAQGHFKTPYVLISIVEEHRQWFKSAQGTELRGTSRSVSFCTHAILENNVFVVLDATKHPLFEKNELVLKAPFIRFYAGAPIMLHQQYPIGTLCIIDDKPRDSFSDEDAEMLINLASIVSTLLEHRTPILEYTPAL